MEGVGARLGRSSSRYGTTSVFTGPVRKWKKDWVPIIPPSSSNNNSNNQNHNHQPSSSSSVVNGGSLNGNSNGSVSHLRLYKWTPLSQKENSNSNNDNSNQNNNAGNSDNDSPTKENSKEDNVSEPPPKKKFKYIPIAVLEEQKKAAESEESADDEAKPTSADENTEEQARRTDGYGEKPDINDVPVDENQDAEENRTAPGRHDLNESLDLSLGLTSHEGEHDSSSKSNRTKEE